MKFNTVKLLQIFLWLMCAFHLIVGISLNVPIGIKEYVGSSIYGAQVDWGEPQFVYILKPLGAFMFALGIMAAIAARDPVRNKAIVIGFAVLAVLRGLQRIVFQQEIFDTFAIEPGRQVGTIAFMFISAVLLLVLSHFADKQQAESGEVSA